MAQRDPGGRLKTSHKCKVGPLLSRVHLHLFFAEKNRNYLVWLFDGDTEKQVEHCPWCHTRLPDRLSDL